MNNAFSFEVFSDIDYEGMVINISYKGKLLAALNYDQGIDKIEMEFFGQFHSDESIKFLMDDFLKAIERGKQLAIRNFNEDMER